MARGAAKSPEERISEIEDKKLEYQVRINRYREKIAELDQQIKELQNVQNQEKLDKLLQAIAASGKTVDEVMEALNK
ncbi:hypothetical protein [Ethanoligenens harbinense]|uniref:Cortexillin II n=1 Tax=Ethanoligenens harbinense (strain DSM 18485 / JCM 12961 / CGMCC 1.5033 / YUAN-3) TaxID=663278 RepID=E6U9U4_ETHHY|nr:hypothetical protein [Ethanoligenens harbinense]ADU26210.1 cortexillin II [Ethanoligenens harbinense YUAN-3]AVQ95349.1 cortexillin II [Ethanoligenens harbinense YUAN-3]AYF38014.1 cortexillin II [Ethanoligenens harbinense]AYF40759.1 cortexillin II [Ethanoligenens harbinense]QCN91591.1 cortexillin II [Ethanoligenens harbinense]